jgi:hypothetical protein
MRQAEAEENTYQLLEWKQALQAFSASADDWSSMLRFAG